MPCYAAAAFAEKPSLALEHLPAGGLACLPAGALQLRLVMFRDGPAEAEIGDERPALRYAQLPRCGVGVEDRDPADADAARARRQPERVRGEHHGIAQGLRHGLAAEAQALLRSLIAEDRDMARRFLQSRELQAG